MALPTQMLLCILVLIAIPGITGSYYSICPPTSNPVEISTPVFRANLMSILDDVPAAAAPTGFASLRFGLEPTPAFVRGLCFADNPSPQQCLGCLQSTVAELKARNCTYTWFAGIWGDDCFLAYSGHNVSSSYEETFRRMNFTVGDGVSYLRFFKPDELSDLAQSLVPSNDLTTSSGATANTTTRGRSKVRAVAHCAKDRERDCSQCVMDSARYLEECPTNEDVECGYLDGTRAGVAAVLGFNCYLRLEISSPPMSHTPMRIGESLRLLLFVYQLIGLVVYATMM